MVIVTAWGACIELGWLSTWHDRLTELMPMPGAVRLVFAAALPKSHGEPRAATRRKGRCCSTVVFSKEHICLSHLVQFAGPTLSSLA